VFISYSYDTKEHENWVEQLANQLRRDAGVNAMIDKFALNQASDLDEIMTKGFEQSDKVIIVATKQYAEKSKDMKSGVSFENSLATIIARKENKDKLIFIKKDLNANFDEVFPFQFKDYYAIDFSETEHFEEKFKELYHKIWNKEYHIMAEIGNSPFETKNTDEITYESVFGILKTTGFEPYNLTKEKLINKSTIIWPIVPRQQVNLIHKSQLEVVRVLSLLNWDLKVIIANCGHSQITPSKEDVEFKDKLNSCLSNKGITNVSIKFLNEYFSKDFSDGNDILSKFIKISSSLKINELTIFNTKNKTYDEIAQREINERTTLKYISPLLTWAASIYEAEKSLDQNNESKPIIVAGRDEETQWEHVFRKINSDIGAIFIPILKQEDDATIFQDKLKVIFSQKQLEDKLGKGNIDKWLFQSFVCLSEFPKIVNCKHFCAKENINDCNDCLNCIFPNDTVKLPEFINKKQFADLIFPKINPA
jgi:hypothetical protein